MNDQWIKTAYRLPTEEDTDETYCVEATDHEGHRIAVCYKTVLFEPHCFPYWMPRNHLKPYVPPKRWTVVIKDGDRCYLKYKNRVIEVLYPADYGSLDNARAIAQAAANKANEVAP